ncbi:K(+) efflux antiporter 5 [Chlorella vulgaris]
MPVSIDSLTELGDVCNKVCFWLTHLVAQVNADGQGAALKSPPGVSEIFDLALKLPKVDAAQWAAIAKTKTGAALAPAAAGKEPGTRKRMQWTEELTRDLINIVDDDEYRTQHLGKEGTRGGHINWAAVGRHFGFSGSGSLKAKYAELKGLPVEEVGGKTKKDGAAPESEKPPKKAKKEAAAPAAAVPSSVQKAKPAAAPVAAAPVAAATPTDSWTKKQQQELVKLVESEETRKTMLGKKRLRWKRIAAHFDKHVKSCRKQYTKPCVVEAMRPPALTAVVLSLLLLLCGTHGSWGRPAYEEEDSADHLESSAADLPFGALLGQAGTPILERLLAEQEAARDVEGGAPVEGKRAETIAERLDEVLKEEFKKEEEKKDDVGKHYNETVTSEEGTKETVIIISSKKKSNATEEEKAGGKHGATTASSAAAADADASPGDARHIAGGSGGLGDGAALMGALSAADAAVASAEEAASGKEEEKKRKHDLEEKMQDAAEADVDRIIDSKDNEYVLSKPNDDTMGMNLDPQFVRDLTVLIAASAAAGLAMSAVGQPAINGYFVAGSLVGPGGLKLIKEIVQVQSVAQLGVQLLLFTLGLEFSLTKLRAVRNVALLGGLLQTALFAVLAGVGAMLIGTSAAQGAFMGAMVAMSSTSIVVKDCVVGLLFAFMPVLAASGGSSGFDVALLLTVMGRVVLKLAVLVGVALVVARVVLPPTMRALQRRFGPDSFQLAAIAFCLVCALATARQGISGELGAFAAGIMLSATDQQEAVLHHLEPIMQFFVTLFISSTGLVLSPVFLMHHLPILAAGALTVMISKTVLITAVVKAFGYPLDTALAVGLNLSQIGEFVFVLLSVANQQSLLPESVYMLLMGVTALTLLLTPLTLQIANKFIPRARGNPKDGCPASDLELAGLNANGGAQKRRSNGLAELSAKSSPPHDSLGSRGDFQVSGDQLEGGLAHGLHPVRSTLEYRGPTHRAVQLLAHGGGSGTLLESQASGGGGNGRGSPPL